jgi:hypothetical protein
MDDAQSRGRLASMILEILATVTAVNTTMKHTIESLKARTVEEGDCWIWQGYKANGTPQVSHPRPGFSSKMYSVRRLMRDLVTGKPTPDGHYVTRCHESSCVNPDHVLFHMDDQHMKRIGRTVSTSANITRSMKLRKYRIRIGHAKLSEQIAQDIRLSNESCATLGERYGVDKSLISKVRRGIAWKVLANPFQGLFQ